MVKFYGGRGPWRVDVIETDVERVDTIETDLGREAREIREKREAEFAEPYRRIYAEKDHVRAVELCLSTEMKDGHGKPFFSELMLTHAMMAIVERLK